MAHHRTARHSISYSMDWHSAADRRSGVSNIPPIFLHGDLNIWIKEARALPNLDLASERLRKCFTMFGSCVGPCGCKLDKKGMSPGRLSGKQSVITSDPYVSICLRGATVAQTRVIFNSENPSWDEHFSVPVAHPVVNVELQVKDNDVLGAQLIGIVWIPAEKILSGNDIDGWFPITGPYENLKPSPELHFYVQFQPVEDNPLYRHAVGPGPEYAGVPNTYFPLRKGCTVTLYQDAHVPQNMLPEIPLDEGKTFRQNQCWEDICHAMLEAHNLIYVTGWSIYHRIKLVREPTKPLPSAGELTLGELLKYKSEEGLRVILLVWDDKTSHDKFLFKTDGVMQTHDEETKKFFKHSSVHCVLCPRYASSKLSIFKQQVVGTLFTHHQKCVLLDTQAPGNNRKITAFIGGLDLCDGRYDTPEHRLFRNLDTIFENDVHNPTFTSVPGGPREPWHDLHCRIDGPAAHDIMTNFEQRWRKAAKWRDIRLRHVRHWHENTLLKIDRLSFILTPKSGPDGDLDVRVTTEEDPENWHVQIFRSIDSGSVKGFPKGTKEAEAQSLVCGKNLKVDRSIHTAYVKAIRSAQHFIYIENQYFIGSSYYWPSYKNAGADNLIPMELALKIANKISDDERFSVYILVPLWPEGIPSSGSVQEILYWQGQTISMMYGIVAEALEKAGLAETRHPQDYLNFYCLGKREIPSVDSISPHDIPPDTHGHFPVKLCPGEFSRRLVLSTLISSSILQTSSQKHGRFMIYVHAKGMIIDDEYIIMGSANLNQRSLDGSRDTEIAMGSYQPRYTWANQNNPPRGQVYGYRMSLWAEHLGKLEKCFEEPESYECVEHVNKIAKSNWDTFAGEENQELTGHLMRYPIQVGRNGKVSSLPGHELFPDVGGKILGAPTNLPDVLTT